MIRPMPSRRGLRAVAMFLLGFIAVAAIAAVAKLAGVYDESWIWALIGAAVAAIVVVGWDMIAGRDRSAS
jgi:hypothetical protein